MARELLLRPQPADVRTAREFCTRELRAAFVRYDSVDERCGHSLDERVHAGALITSELVTNAIRAGARRIRLLVERRRDRFRIAVIDDADGAVVPGPEFASAKDNPLAVHGRGLRLVAAYACAWGVSQGPEGKQVWADLNLPASNQSDESSDAAGADSVGRCSRISPDEETATHV